MTVDRHPKTRLPEKTDESIIPSCNRRHPPEPLECPGDDHTADEVVDKTECQAGDKEHCREVDEHPHAENRRETGDQEEENPVIESLAKTCPGYPILQDSIDRAVEQRKGERDADADRVENCRGRAHVRHHQRAPDREIFGHHVDVHGRNHLAHQDDLRGNCKENAPDYDGFYHTCTGIFHKYCPI